MNQVLLLTLQTHQLCRLLELCEFILHPLLLPSKEGRMQALSSECKFHRANFAHWMSFLPSDHMEQISLNSEAFSANTDSLPSAWNSLEKTNILYVNALILTIP